MDTEDSLSFDTAWSRPEPVVSKLSGMFPELLITHRWADGDLGHNVGEAEYQNGEMISENLSTPGSREDYDMAAEIGGIGLSEYGFSLSEDGSEYVFFDKELSEDPADPGSKLVCE